MRLFICLLVSVVAAAQPDAIVQKWHNDPALRGTLFAVCVVDAATGKPLYKLNENISVVTASTMKIFTTGAALALLGGEYTYSTTLAHTGSFDRTTGVIDGDVLIVGGGDPSLQSEYFSRDVIKLWTEKMIGLGVKEISGNIIGQGGIWPRKVPDHWIWADISNYFGAVPSGLSFRDNKFSIGFTSGAPGTPATITGIHPQYTRRQIVLNSSVTCKGTQDQAYVYGDPFGFDKNVSGTIPANKGTFSIEAALPDPALLCAEEFFDALVAAGIRCNGSALSDYKPLTYPVQHLHTHLSPALATLVEYTNQRSNNLYCESLFMAMGDGNSDSATATVKKFWRSAGVDENLLYMADGSGLSRAGTATALLQTQALSYLYNRPSFKTFDQSLPRAGREGSMRPIGKGTFIEANLRAKTGYMERVRAYCGYLKTRGGKDLAFSVIFNNFNCTPAVARKRMEELLVALADL